MTQVTKTINRKDFDKLGKVIRDWLEENEFQTDANQDLELEQKILECLGIKKDW